MSLGTQPFPRTVCVVIPCVSGCWRTCVCIWAGQVTSVLYYSSLSSVLYWYIRNNISRQNVVVGSVSYIYMDINLQRRMVQLINDLCCEIVNCVHKLNEIKPLALTIVITKRHVVYYLLFTKQQFSKLVKIQEYIIKKNWVYVSLKLFANTKNIVLQQDNL